MKIPFRAPILRVSQPAATFYVATVPVNDLLCICRPLYKPVETGVFARESFQPVELKEDQLDKLISALDSPKFQRRAEELLSEEPRQQYQRFVDAKRAQKIAEYLEQPDALLPNSIILAVDLGFDEPEIIKSGANGHLTIVLPREEKSAVILDGQHRVEGFRYLKNEIRSRMSVVVTFLVEIPFYQQAEIFAVINGRQKPVNRSIIFDLFGYAPLGGTKDEKLYEGLMAVSRFCSHVARILNRFEESPWQAKIKMRGPGDVGLISQAAVVEYLAALVEPKTFTRRLKVLPLLYSFFKESDPAGCASLLILYIRAIQAALVDQFANSRSLLWKNNGVAVIMRILHDDILLAGGPEQLMDSYKLVVERWRKAPPDDVANPPKTGGGGIQNDLYAKFRAEMFTPKEIEKLGVMQNTLKEKLIGMGGLIT